MNLMIAINKTYFYFSYIKKASIFIAGIALFIMFLFITLDVFFRNVLSSSIGGSYEIVENYLMTTVSFSVILYAYSSGIMPRISMVVEKLPHSIQKSLHMVMLIIEFILKSLI